MRTNVHESNELGPVELDRIVEAGRDTHLHKYLAETDENLSARLMERYRDAIPAARIEAALAMPTRFEDRETFDRMLSEAGGKPDAESRVLGYSRFDVEPAHVALDHLEIPKTIAHERLHQLSDPVSKRELGDPLYEGVTEDLAIDAIGSESRNGRGDCYPEERAIAHEMREIAGDSAVERAYFAGDTTELRRNLDERLGPGGLEQLQKRFEELSKKA